MTLEDFFTLNEMNNGLSAPDRVRELVSVMQKEKDHGVKNVSDETRQWSAVASVIAATENKDCIHLFIQLDGLRYLNRWLKEAEKLGNNTSDSSAEDSISDLLGALERFQANIDNLVASGIWVTVKDLLRHSSSKVQDKAKSLFNSWNKEKENYTVTQGEKIKSTGDEAEIIAEHVEESASVESFNKNTIASRESFKVEKQEEASKDNRESEGSETLKAEKIEGRTLDDAILNEEGDSTNSSSFSKPSIESLRVKSELPSLCSKGATLPETCSSAGLKKCGLVKEMSGLELDATDDVKKMENTSSSDKKVVKIEVPKSTLSTDEANAFGSATVSEVSKNRNATENNVGSKFSSSGGLKTVESEAKSNLYDDISSGYCRNSASFRRKEEGKCYSDVLQDSNARELNLDNFKDSGAFFPRMENARNVERMDEDISKRSEGCLSKDYDFPKLRMHRKDHGALKKSDFDLDYGIVDPLEVARQVAIEVEREVEDNGERSCSSSEKESGGKVKSPHSVRKPCESAQNSIKEVTTEPDILSDSPIGEEPMTSTGNLEAEQINGTQDAESSHVTEASQEPEANNRKGPSHFDLNQEVCSEDVEYEGELMSTPVSVVSASRATAAPGMPVAPLQFEGALGWKGSAATSAFRAASPRRAPESDSSLSAGGSNSSSKQNRSFLNFDLNIAETGDDKNLDMHSGKQIPVSSQHASGESSIETSPRKCQRLEIDLNQTSDEGDAPPGWRPEGDRFDRRNFPDSQSPSSSSSKQPWLRNIDLNDQPTFANDSSTIHYHSNASQNAIASRGIKSDDSVISIMGMRVEVNRKDSAAGTFPLPNERPREPPINVNFTTGGIFGMGTPAPYAHPHPYGYNGVVAGPPFSSPLYGPVGPIPYMVDSRGAPVVPQMMVSSSPLPPAIVQPPYIFTMNGAPVSNSVRPLQNGFDLNSGLVLEGRNRDLGGFRQLFYPAQVRPMDEHLKDNSANSQPSTSSGFGVIGGKRKEPNGGYEGYPFKHHSQPWR